MMHGYYGFEMWGWVILMILFWFGIAGLTIWGLKTLVADGQSVQLGTRHSALEIAQARYSHGELSREEYIALVNDLKQTKETIK